MGTSVWLQGACSIIGLVNTLRDCYNTMQAFAILNANGTDCRNGEYGLVAHSCLMNDRTRFCWTVYRTRCVGLMHGTAVPVNYAAACGTAQCHSIARCMQGLMKGVVNDRLRPDACTGGTYVSMPVSSRQSIAHAACGLMK
jgi:hypothetical protein